MANSIKADTIKMQRIATEMAEDALYVVENLKKSSETVKSLKNKGETAIKFAEISESDFELIKQDAQRMHDYAEKLKKDALSWQDLDQGLANSTKSGY